ncbi:MAG: hypothetical protein NT020_13215, partial [Chloroflexales bacterium]|nr:hypothetical protein [Chloroflexales bacterium]
VAAVISRALTPGLAVLSLTMMPKLKQYRITLYQSGNAPMSAALNENLHLQDPITIHSALAGQSPYLVNFRIYKTILDDANISAIASSLLGSQGTSASGITPRSDVLTFNAEARAKVVQSDPDFEHDYTSGATTQMQLAFDEPALSSRFSDIINMPRADNIAVTCDPSTCPQSGVPGVTGNALWFNSAPKNERIIENYLLNSAIAGAGLWYAYFSGRTKAYASVCDYPYSKEMNRFLNADYSGWFWQTNPPKPYLNCVRRERIYSFDNAQWLTLPADNSFMKFLTAGTPGDQAQIPAKFDFWIKPTAYGGRIIDHKLVEIGLDTTGHITVKHAVNQQFPANQNFSWDCYFNENIWHNLYAHMNCSNLLLLTVVHLPLTISMLPTQQQDAMIGLVRLWFQLRSYHSGNGHAFPCKPIRSGKVLP